MDDKHEQLGRDARDPFLLGDFRVDPGALCMGRSGACERIEAKTMQVLLALADRPDQVVTREELAHQVWPGRIVTDDALTNAIGKLRRALDDDARSPRFVETIAKRGYRLKVAPMPAGSARPRPDMTVFAGAHKQRIRLVGLLLLGAAIAVAALVYWSATRMPEIPAVSGESAASVAVMPFELLGGNPSHRYFAEGITLDVITELSRIPGLLVIAPGSAFGYRETSATDAAIAAELGVHYLIRGGVQRLGDHIRINVRLLAAERGETLWAERFAGEASSLFRIQDQLVSGIATALPVRMALSEPHFERSSATASIAAYDAFLRGRERYGRLTPEDNRAARRHFERAIELDPGFARAYAGLALTWSRLAIDGWTEDAERALLKAAEYAERAASLDATVPQIHFVRGQVDLFRGRYSGAAASAARAIELDPNYADAYALLAWIFNYAGRSDRAEAALTEAHRRNPSSSASYREIAGEIAFTKGAYDQAAEAFEAALARNPAHTRARLWLAAALSQLGYTEEAAWQVDELLTLSPEFSLSRLLFAFPLKDPGQRETLTRAVARLGLPE